MHAANKYICLKSGIFGLICTQAAVFGVPNELMGELVYAAVRLNPGCVPGKDVTAIELVHLCREHLSAYKVWQQLHSMRC